jgi:flagella basal body P-ring formation protein FlgA
MGVKCTEKDVHWTLYIPIKVSILKTVLLTKNARKKGEKLTADDLYQTEMDAQKLKQGYFTDAKQLIGLVCKKDIAADTPITPYNIELEKLVLRGQEVSINASSGTLSIKMGGTALSDGALGDVIKVKNTTSKRVIDAQVSGKQTVNVAM